MADPYKDKVVLYLPFEGSRHGDTVILDKTGKTVTRNGDTILSTTVAPPFGTTSCYFDGAGDYLSLADSADWVLGTCFTIEFFVKRATTAVNHVITQQITDYGGGTLRGHQLYLLSGGTIYLEAYNSNSGVNRSFSVTGDTNWHHVAVSLDGQRCYIAYDGVVSDVGTAPTVGDSANVLEIGRGYGGGSLFSGYIKDLRITKGVARYTRNFYVDQKPFDWDTPEQPRIMI